MDKKRNRPARWRKARFPEAGTRWDTPMNRSVWNREHGADQELWRGDVRLAIVFPDGRWKVFAGTGRVGQEASWSDAMKRARYVVRELEAQS